MGVHLKSGVLAALALSAAAAVAMAQPAASPPGKPPPSTKIAPKCFRSHDWESWKPAENSKAIYIRVNINQFYRIDFSDSCPMVQSPNVHLVTRTINDLVCTPLDLDLKVADPPTEFAIPCIVTGITPMSPAEAAALPKKLQP
jgi:hypothetical protein